MDQRLNSPQIAESIHVLSAIFAKISLGILFVDPVTQQIYFGNSTLWQLLRAEPSDGCCLVDLGIHEPKLAQLKAQFSEEQFSQEQPITAPQSWLSEHTIRFADNSELVADLNWMLLRLGVVPVIMVVFSDVTVNKQQQANVLASED
ncbi:MAG: hypothetical protein J0M22_02200 [Gammaproteobacteria bacterium]|nr:hypothetical protein [Gammaproteobacteria bacterium]